MLYRVKYVQNGWKTTEVVKGQTEQQSIIWKAANDYTITTWFAQIIIVQKNQWSSQKTFWMIFIESLIVLENWSFFVEFYFLELLLFKIFKNVQVVKSLNFVVKFWHNLTCILVCLPEDKNWVIYEEGYF
jgi:hypothetical protein